MRFYIQTMMAGNKKGKKKHSVAIIGYGSQGRAIALNLRDSGFQVVIGLPSGSRSRRKANSDKFKPVYSVTKAVESAEIICFAFPDHLHGKTYISEIKEFLTPGQTLWFLHGLSVHFGYVHPPGNCDLILIAPHAPGTAVRESYGGSGSISAFSAIGQDISGVAKDTIWELAEGLGFKSKKLVPTTFEAEALGDLFGEQAVLCGGLVALINSGFERLVEEGISPDNAYLEVAFQLDLIIQLIKRHGFDGMFDRISVAAQYGAMTAGPEIINDDTRERMKKMFDLIKSGKFTKELCELTDEKLSKLRKSARGMSNPLFDKAVKKFKE